MEAEVGGGEGRSAGGRLGWRGGAEDARQAEVGEKEFVPRRVKRRRADGARGVGWVGPVRSGFAAEMPGERGVRWFLAANGLVVVRAVGGRSVWSVVAGVARAGSRVAVPWPNSSGLVFFEHSRTVRAVASCASREVYE